MKLLSLLKVDLVSDKTLESYWSLDHVPFFARGTIREIIEFGAREICGRITRNEKNELKKLEKMDTVVSVKYKQQYTLHVLLSRSSRKCAWVATTDDEYPSRVITDMLYRAQASDNVNNTGQLL